MPPKKRALDEGDTNAQSAPKRQSTGSQSSATEENQENNDNSDDWVSKKSNDNDEHPEDCKCLREKDPAEYICIDPPFWNRKHDEESDDEESDEDESKNEDDTMFPKPAADHPEWKWTMMWKSWELLCEYGRKADYVHPDTFGMYINNDFRAYGVVELVENLIVDFNKEFVKKDTNLQHMWAIVAGLGHWLQDDEMAIVMIMIDDGERAGELVGVLGCLLLSALEMIDRAGRLCPDSDFRDLGLVMSIYLEWSRMSDYGIESDEWRSSVVAYAMKASIDLVATGCDTAAEVLEKLKEDSGEVEALKASKKADRWDWKKTLKAYNHGGKLGGTFHDITKMTRNERASYAFDKKDPPAQFSIKDLKEGNIMLG